MVELRSGSFLSVNTKDQFIHRVELVLKISMALCFIGHGFWGTISKPDWVGLITPLGFSKDFALASLPIVGWLDIALAVCILIQNNLAWVWKAMTWTVFTAFLRPIAGMSFFEVPERAGNWGIPLAFLFMVYGLCSNKKIFATIDLSRENLSAQLKNALVNKIKLTLQISIGLLLIGHGGLVAIAEKQIYVKHLLAIGIDPSRTFMMIYGYFEILMGIGVAIKPTKTFLWFIFVWKLATESLYVFAGRAVDIFETIERAGDYCAPIALILVLSYQKNSQSNTEHSVEGGAEKIVA